jgi:DNA-binding NtrC family response regulator
MNSPAWRVLMLDDELNLLSVLEEKLRREGFDVKAFSDPSRALEQIELSDVDVVLTDLSMPGKGGMEILDHCRERRPDLPVILMTAYGSVEKAVEAMRRGAFDFITKPFDSAALVELLRKAAGVLKAQSREPRASVEGDPWAVVRVFAPGSPMEDLLSRIEKVAALDAPLLLVGEQGTGREALAREVHRISGRASDTFVKLHCSALSEELVEAELFGLEEKEGQSRPGRIELAHGGTLFLEGVIELPLATQGRLLRFLSEGVFERVGGLKTRKTRVRVIAASDASLQKKGSGFRADLATALSAFSFRLPAIRERRMDIRRLSQFFLRQATHRTNRIVQGISEDLMAALEQQDWPGNLKQLENMIESMVLLSSGTELSMREFSSDPADPPQLSFKEQVRLHTQQLERSLIEAELERQDGNVSRTAEALGLSRKGLQLKLKELGIRRTFTE